MSRNTRGREELSDTRRLVGDVLRALGVLVVILAIVVILALCILALIPWFRHGPVLQPEPTREPTCIIYYPPTSEPPPAPPATPTHTPRPTRTPRPTHTPTPTCEPLVIKLRVHVSERCGLGRRRLWAVLQRQDDGGAWCDVDGWRMRLGEDGCGEWPVAPGDLGEGPFRWAILLAEGGEAMATSGPCHLPRRPCTIVVVDITIVCIERDACDVCN